jgi:hypothetical protein
VLQPSQWPTLAELVAALLAFGDHSSAIAPPFDWRFTRLDLQRVLAALPARSHAA